MDARRLYDDFGIRMQGWLDLRHVCWHLDNQNEIHFKKYSLKQIAATLFGAPRLSYSMMRKLAFSDWTIFRLSPLQIYYAAWDAQIAIDIFCLVTQLYFCIRKLQLTLATYL